MPALMMKKIISIALVLTSVVVYAQKTVDIRLNLRDGSSISGTTSLNDVILKTNYGQLSIPVKNISTIAMGIGRDKAVAEKALVFLKVLNGNGNDESKKGAYEDLVKLGIKAISAINDFQADPKNTRETVDVTGEYTIDNALNELSGNLSIDDVSKVNDVVTIDNEYTMGGSYEFNKLEVKTEYGNLSIPKEKISTIDISYSEPGNGNEVVLKLLANKHITGNQQGGWLKTGIVLKQGQKFTITASGEVSLASLSNQKYKPDGSYVSADGVAYPVTAAVDEYETSTTYPSYGNVVYKIGDTGQDMKAGAKLNGTAKASGMLFISIYETVYNAANKGSYTVKITPK